MPKLERVDKLPLATRKNLRDEWESVKPELEKKISEILGTPWVVNIDPNVIFPYGDNSRKEALGRMITTYIEGAVRKLEAFEEVHGAAGVAEINSICYAHAITMDFDEEQAKKWRYVGADVVEGQLRILFEFGEIGNSMYDALREDNLERALTEAAPAAGSAMSYSARAHIRLDYDAKIEDVRLKIAALLGRADVALDPSFENTFAQLAEESRRKKTQLSRTWQQDLGDVTKKYFEGVAFQLKHQKFGEDELLREGFNDIVESGRIVFRMVEKIENDEECDCIIEDGVLYLQTTAKTWDHNNYYAAKKLVDLL